MINKSSFEAFASNSGEIEAALRTHPLVKECVVVLREDSSGRKLLVAYVTLGTNVGAETNLEQSAIPGKMPETLKSLYKPDFPST